MTAKVKFGCALAAVAAVLLAGCASTEEAEKTATPAVTAIGEAALPESIRLGREAGATLLKALAANDFNLVKDLPVGHAEDTLSKEKFDGLVNKVIAPNGGIASSAYLGDLARGAYRRMLWKVSFLKPVKELEGNDVIFEVWVGRLDGQLRIVGFQFHP